VKDLNPIITQDGAYAGLRFKGHLRPEAAGSERWPPCHSLAGLGWLRPM
jgi:hypothetical protein